MPVISGGELRLAQASIAKVGKNAKTFYKGFIHTISTDGKLVLSKNSYVKGRFLEFFKLSDNALISDTEINALKKVFKDGKVSNAKIKEILGEVDEVKRVSLLRGVSGAGTIADLLKNIDFKKIYFDLLNGVTPRKFADELSLLEEGVYKFYTNNSYYNFNQALISKDIATDVLEIEKLLNNTLDKVPSSPGTYYRGIGKSEINELKKGEFN